MRDRHGDTHRNVVERTQGPVGPDQIVHHKDEDKSNNSPLNLEVTTRRDHTILHNKTRSLGKLRKALTMHRRGEKLY